MNPRTRVSLRFGNLMKLFCCLSLFKWHKNLFVIFETCYFYCWWCPNLDLKLELSSFYILSLCTSIRIYFFNRYSSSSLLTRALDKRSPCTPLNKPTRPLGGDKQYEKYVWRTVWACVVSCQNRTIFSIRSNFRRSKYWQISCPQRHWPLTSPLISLHHIVTSHLMVWCTRVKLYI